MMTGHLFEGYLSSQMSKFKIGIPLTGLTLPHLCACLKHLRSWSFLCSESKGERWLFVLLILVEVWVTITVKTFFVLLILVEVTVTITVKTFFVLLILVVDMVTITVKTFFSYFWKFVVCFKFQAFPSPDMDTCLCGVHLFMNTVKLDVSEKYVIILSKADGVQRYAG
jgi:hypothetical protein